jgi:disulfide oxidoreductase YuzD
MAECFMNKVLTSVEKESYDLLLHILKKEMCNISHDYQTIVDALEKTTDQSGLNFFLSIQQEQYKISNH